MFFRTMGKSHTRHSKQIHIHHSKPCCQLYSDFGLARETMVDMFTTVTAMVMQDVIVLIQRQFYH
jgi:hypothetical protein